MDDNGVSLKTPIINGVLCYISTARHSMRTDDITRICHAFFKDEAIIKAKDLLCELTGEKSKRRRNENKIVHELGDILESFKKCDDANVELPKFVVDSFDGLPPSSGFEIIAGTLISLNEEIVLLRKEVEALKEKRLDESVYSQDTIVMKEDILAIKGELRKLNHRFLKDDVRRSSILLGNLDKPGQSNSVIDQADKSCGGISDSNDALLANAAYDIEKSIDVRDSVLSPTAPPFRSQGLLDVLNQSFQDLGGSPSAPTYAQVTALEDKRSEVDVTKASSSHGAQFLSKRPLNDSGKDAVRPASSRTVVDAEGFQLVQRNRKKRENIVGSKKLNKSHVVKSAVKIVDVYVGNLDPDVTVEALNDYIKSDIGVKIEKCETLQSRNPHYRSFKLSININDRGKLLSSEVWPEGIICRKYYSARNNNSK